MKFNINTSDIKYLNIVSLVSDFNIYLCNGYSLIYNFPIKSLDSLSSNLLKKVPNYANWYKARITNQVDINFQSIKKSGVIGGFALSPSLSLVIFVPDTSNYHSISISELKNLDIIRVRNILELLYFHFFNKFPKLLPDQNQNLSNDNLPTYIAQTDTYDKVLIYKTHQEILHSICTRNEESFEKYSKKYRNIFTTIKFHLLYPHVTNWLISEITLYCEAGKKGGLSWSNAEVLKEQLINQVYNSRNIIDPIKYIYTVGQTILARLKQPNISNSYFVNKVNQYLNQHITSSYSINDLSKDIGFNKSYLMTRYKQETNSTIKKQFNKLKIEAAKKQILYSNDSMTKISEQFNFKSPNYFSTVFKKYTGESPKEWKKSRRISF